MPIQNCAEVQSARVHQSVTLGSTPHAPSSWTSYLECVFCGYPWCCGCLKGNQHGNEKPSLCGVPFKHTTHPKSLDHFQWHSGSGQIPWRNVQIGAFGTASQAMARPRISVFGDVGLQWGGGPAKNYLPELLDSSHLWGIFT